MILIYLMYSCLRLCTFSQVRKAPTLFALIPKGDKGNYFIAILMALGLQTLYGFHTFVKLYHKPNTRLEGLIEKNSPPYGIKKSDSTDSLDKISYYSFNTNTKYSYPFAGYDERYPIDQFLNYEHLSNKTNNHSLPMSLEEYKTLLKISLFLLKYKFVCTLENPEISNQTKIHLINKHYQKQKSSISAPNLFSGGLMDDFLC